MLNRFDYPKGFGPDNSLGLDISNAFMADIPAGYRGTFTSKISGSDRPWLQAICIYSMLSGAKVSELGNYSRQTHTEFVIKNNSSETISYLLTGWHKPSAPPTSGIAWQQTGNIGNSYTDVYDGLVINITFNQYGDSNPTEKPYLRNEMQVLIEPITRIIRPGS
ncbi:hypothetical protein PVA17_16005 [Lysinibacillus sp. CNPSo 3705]|uniref:hypothetical protein n=1 Tax=Lysinibacillus sp. CNPSo 3705 TaxID=3028148 RepID=UPI0023636171|nr:hypothetical protein [Lysinibacillus sp. CNPSo 3705]MDD1504250.1 hypothetical protein [Lysinibacillus sp. CNPSo 3705]